MLKIQLLKRDKCYVVASISDFLDVAQDAVPIISLLVAFVVGLIGLITSDYNLLKISAIATVFAGIIFIPIRVIARMADKYYCRISREKWHSSTDYSHSTSM